MEIWEVSDEDQGSTAAHDNSEIIYILKNLFKCRFLEFKRHHNFANFFSKLSESTFYKEINKFQ